MTKNINEMSYEEIINEIKNVTEFIDDKEMMLHNAAYLAELADELAKRANAD